ncbi:AFG2-interacting ribosome maturation factor-like [Haemaphysalis longicornis]
MMDEIADLYAVRKSFKLAFCALREQTLAWEKCMNNCSPHLRAIATLREIQTNCRTAKLVGTELLSKYPDIRERVLCNVENELLGERDRLESVLKDLKKSQNILSSACQQAIHAYEQQSQSLSAEDICYRSEVCPSVADMLEWITSAEQEFGSHVHARELLLEEANFGDDFKTATFVKEWKDDAALLESLNDALATTKFIMEMS